jgi:toxin YoeB
LRNPANARRTDEHRLVYKLAGDELRIAAGRYHYA